MEKQKITPTHGSYNSTTNLTAAAAHPSSISIISDDVDRFGKEKQYNPFEHRNIEHPNTVCGSILNLLKACVGSGILAMPAGFKSSGLAGGVVGTAIAGAICVHATDMLVKTSQRACVVARRPQMGYAETCGAAFTHGPKGLQKYAGAFQAFVDYAMTLTYISILCVYVVFIASSFKEVVDVYSEPEKRLSIQVYCALSLIPLLLISQVRNLKYLVPFSALANIFILLVMAATLYYIFDDLPSINETDRELFTEIGKWPTFLSTVIFAMEGIGVVMPVENDMARPERFGVVLYTAMTVVIFAFGFLGFFGFLKYGDAVKGSITLNLPEDSWIPQGTKLLMALAILLTYALQFYVPMEMVSRKLEKKVDMTRNCTQISTRSVIVILSVIIAVAVPNLELVINLVGAIFLSTLGLLIPAVIETVFLWDRGLGRFNYVLWKNCLISIVALLALVCGTMAAVSQMVEEYRGASNDDVFNATRT